SRDELQNLSITSGWQLPRSVAPLACAEENLGAVAMRLGGEVIATQRDGVGCLLFPDPEGPGRRATLMRVAESSDARLALGPTLTLPYGTSRGGRQPVPESAVLSGARAWALTRLALRLPVTTPGRLVSVDDHLGEL